MEVRNLTKNEDFFVSFELSTQGAEWQKYLKDVSARLQSRKPVPGYRKGKAPLPVALTHYGKELLGIAFTDASLDLMGKVCDREGFAPVSEPSTEMLSMERDHMAVRCSFYTYPEIPDYDYHGLTVERPVRAVTEADVNAAVDDYMKNHLYVHEVQREARTGDIVEIRYIWRKAGDGEYDRERKCRITMGYEELFAGLDEALLGHVGGDRLKLTLENPPDYRRGSVAGMTVDVEVSVVGVWARDRLECTDAYCRDTLPLKEINTVAEFRAKLRKDLEKENEDNSNEFLRLRMEKALASTVRCTIPEAMMEVTLKDRANTLAAICRQQGITVEQALKDEGVDLEGFLEMARPSCDQQLRQTIAIDHIIRRDQLVVGREELQRHLRRRMETEGLSLEEAADREGGEAEVLEKLLHAKAVETFRQSVTVIDVPVDQWPEE